MNELSLSLPKGSVLIDNTTLNIVGGGSFGHFRETSWYDLPKLREINFWELIESIILHDHLWVEGSIFQRDRYAQKVAQISGNIIKPMEIGKDGIDYVYGKVLNLFTEDDNLNVVREFDIATLIDYWESNYEFYNVTLRRGEDVLFEHLYDRESKFNTRYFAFSKIRTYFYFFLSQYLNVPYIPSSLRTPLLLRFMKNQNEYPQLKSFSSIALKKVEEIASSVVERATQDIGENIFQFKLPILKHILPSNPEKPFETLDAALRLRETSEAKYFRKWCAELDKDAVDGNIANVYRALKDIEQLQNSLMNKLGTSRDSFTITIGFPLSLGIDVTIPTFRKRYLLFLRNIFERAVKLK